MYRVLHLMGYADAGGIARVVLNYFEYIDRTKFHFDIALTGGEPGEIGKMLMAMGAHCYRLPLKSKGIKKFQNELFELLQRQQFDAIHVHESSSSYVALAVAKKAGVKCRIVHAHTAELAVTMRGRLYRYAGYLFNGIYATAMIGCGKLASERVFGKYNMKRKNAFILPNAVDINKFSFDILLRKKVREELGIQGKFVLGLVGRFANEKNQKFAVDLMKEIQEKISESILLLVGGGEDEAEIKKIVEKENLAKHVCFLGKRNDIERVYQAMDVLIMPSLFEGFPVAAVEALASGLPVVLSDLITEELIFGEEVHYLSLKDRESWVSCIEDIYNRCVPNDRKERQKEVLENGFDIKQTVHLLEKIYLE